nr:hypothetical protein [Granulicatella balaenopterae]
MMFITLPKAFLGMSAGRVIGMGFFMMVFLAALTSSIALMEAVTSIFMDLFAISIRKATAITLLYALPFGGVISLGYKFAAKTHMLACGMKAASLYLTIAYNKHI